MIRVVICDDRQEHLQAVHSACLRYFAAHPEHKIELLTFGNPLLCLEKLEQLGGCDLALLDICMPGISGVGVAREMLTRNSKTRFIFITTSNEFAVEAFMLGAAHYLLKPFTDTEFDSAMDRAIKPFLIEPVKKLYLQGEGGAVHAVDTVDILYVESLRNRRNVHTAAGVYTETKRTLQALLDELETLCPGQFISPYRGYIINFKAVRSITKQGVLLKDGSSIPIKPDSFRRLRDSYFIYEFAREG